MAGDRTTYIVLFRGVGGATQLPTARLRAALAEEGFDDVATYINSGNAVFSTTRSRVACHDAVSRLVRDRFGFGKEIFLRSAREWAAAIDANPFPEATEAPTTLHLFALEREAKPHAVETLRARLAKRERIVVEGEHMYFHAPDGFGKSKTPPLIDRLLGMPTTARNWNTAVKLRKMAEAIA